MWPLHVRTKEEYVRLIENCLEREKSEELTDTVAQAFEDYQEDEGFAAWLVGVAHGTHGRNAEELAIRFIEKFPLSLHPIQVDWAELLMEREEIDHGSNEARAYLNRAWHEGLDKLFDEVDQVRDGCSRAFLAMTAVYTESGARSYSQRVLEYGMMMQPDEFWQSRYRTEHIRLAQELTETRHMTVNRLWEEFFQGGRNADALQEHLAGLKYTILAKRVEILARMFKDDAQYRPGDEEVFQLLYQTEKGAFVLV